MTRHIGVVMDPIESIKPHKDSTFAMVLEAQARGWAVEYMQVGDLRLVDGEARGRCRRLTVRDADEDWYACGEVREVALASLDLILMRKDPPVDSAYLTATFVLDRAEADGTLVANRPSALRDLNEKLVTAWFPGCCPPTILTPAAHEVKAFLEAHGSVVLKRVDGMGGRSVFALHAGDPNTNVILEEMTLRGTRSIVAQAYLPAVAETGDKRILLVEGEAVEHTLTRIPREGEFRANLATGARAEPSHLTDRERWICGEIGPVLRERGVSFAGIDVIGGHLTEVNVTSPTCIREIDRFHGTRVAARLLDALESRLG